MNNTTIRLKSGSMIIWVEVDFDRQALLRQVDRCLEVEGISPNRTNSKPATLAIAFINPVSPAQRKGAPIRLIGLSRALAGASGQCELPVIHSVQIIENVSELFG